jgi:hypothetical protein
MPLAVHRVGQRDWEIRKNIENMAVPRVRDNERPFGDEHAIVYIVL